MAYSFNGHEIDPGAYDVEKLEIVGDDTVDITYLMLELNINENIFTKCITGSLVIQDTINIVTNLPLMEGDLIKGLLKTNKKDPFVIDYDPDESIEFEFEIVKITTQERVKQDVQVWSISFVSETWSDNLANRVSKSYHQMLYSDMVTDIFNMYLRKGGLGGTLAKKGLEVIPTEGIYNIVIPNLKPYDAITFLSRRSYLGDAANYLFFENKDSFFYKPINELLAEGPVETYYPSSADEYTDVVGTISVPNANALRKHYLGINNMKFLGYHDLSSASAAGMISNRLVRYDPFYKRIKDYHPRGPEGLNYTIDPDIFDYSLEFGKLNHCENNELLIRSKTSTKFSYEDANSLLTVMPDHFWLWDDQESYKPEKWIRERKGHMHQLRFVKFQITVPGNFTRKIGTKINLELWSPEWKPKAGSERPIPDSRLKGNYFITALRRKFTKDRHTTVMEVIKDNYFELTSDMPEPSGYPEIKYDGHGSVRGA